MKITDKHGQQWQLVPTTENAWMLDDENINELQVSSIYTVINRCRHAHFTNIKIRINGAWEEFEADWIKHIKPIAAAPEPELSGELEPVAYSYTSKITKAETLTHQPPDRFIEPEQFIIKPLVLQSAALAALAEKDAEIAELKRALGQPVPLSDWQKMEQTVQRQAALIEQCRGVIIKLFGCYPPPYDRDPKAVMVRKALAAIEKESPHD